MMRAFLFHSGPFSMVHCLWLTVILSPGILMTSLTGTATSNGNVLGSAGAAVVVGILAQPRRNDDSDDSENDYVAASYVKWCEAGGATTVAVPYNATDLTIYDELLQQMDGLLLPGGASPLSRGVVYLLDQIVHWNAHNEEEAEEEAYFPVWGTCLGFEFLITYMGGTMESGFVAENVSLPLEQVQPRELYADPTIYKAVTTQNITLNNHQQGIRPETFAADPILSKHWQVTSINHDQAGVPFVSTVEPMDPDTFPFWGVQYHPEKNAFEYGVNAETGLPYEDINHSAIAVQFSLQLAQFWIGKVRRHARSKSNRHKTSRTTQSRYNYPPLFTFPIQSGHAFEQVHLIPKDYPRRAAIPNTVNSTGRHTNKQRNGKIGKHNVIMTETIVTVKHQRRLRK